jgi:hypothetical protein
MKEDLMLDSFMMLLDTKSYEGYLYMMPEIALICELFVRIFTYEKGTLMFGTGLKVFKICRRLIGMISANKNIEFVIDNEKMRYDFHLSQLYNFLTPISVIKTDFREFFQKFKETVNYQDFNIQTVITNRQFSLTEKNFPAKSLTLKAKKTIEYIKYFKTFSQKDSRLYSILSSLKIIKLTLNTNINFIHLFFKGDCFSVILYFAQISEYILQNVLNDRDCSNLSLSILTGLCFSGENNLAHGFDNNDLELKNNIVRSFLGVIKECLEIFAVRIKFKLDYDSNKDYNNMELFKVVIGVLSIVKQLFPEFYEDSLLGMFYEKGSAFDVKTRFKIKKRALVNLYGENQSSFQGVRENSYLKDHEKKFIGQESNYYAQCLVKICLEIIESWTLFSGSYEKLLTEVLSMVMSDENYYEKGFLLGILSVICYKPRLFKNRDRYNKILKASVFDKLSSTNPSSAGQGEKSGGEKSKDKDTKTPETNAFMNKLSQNSTMNPLIDPPKELKQIFSFNMNSQYRFECLCNDVIVENGNSNFIFYFLDEACQQKAVGASGANTNFFSKKNEILDSVC